MEETIKELDQEAKQREASENDPEVGIITRSLIYNNYIIIIIARQSLLYFCIGSEVYCYLNGLSSLLASK